MSSRFAKPLSLTPENWVDLVASLTGDSSKTARYRAVQICDWLYKKGVTDYSLMSNLPGNLRDALRENHPLQMPVIRKRTVSQDGTSKFLLELTDRNLIEMVLIPAEDKLTLCISSQVGCLRKCRFCATGSMGFKRNLEADEIVAQILIASHYSSGRRITNLVFMGMGEPLDNYTNVFHTIRLIQNEKTLSFSPRRITLSTCGIIPGMHKLLAAGIKVKLAVSLNSAIQEKREYLMPVASQYPLPELKQALQLYRRNNPFRITMEYVMFGGFNTGEEDAKALIKLLGDLSCKVNLISWNNTSSSSTLKRPSREEIDRFIKYLLPLPFAVTYRKSRGEDINAACGQLSADYQAIHKS